VETEITLLGLELLVADIDTALALFHGALGLELVERRTSDDPAGEVAVLAIGDAALTLLAPSAAGPGRVLDNRTPRVTQVFLGVAPDAVAATAESLAAHGAAVHVVDALRCFVPPAVVEGATGIDTALTVVGVDRDG
jgi:catechol 2,3-dioxygenase-like lactoylglutathione lyase family enzyme